MVERVLFVRKIRPGSVCPLLWPAPRHLPLCPVRNCARWCTADLPLDSTDSQDKPDLCLRFPVALRTAVHIRLLCGPPCIVRFLSFSYQNVMVRCLDWLCRRHLPRPLSLSLCRDLSIDYRW